MAASLVQSSGARSGNGTTQTWTWATAPTVGNVIIVKAVGWASPTGPTASCADAGSNGYTQRTNALSTGSGATTTRGAIFDCVIATPPSSTTLTWSISADHSVVFEEWSGLDTASLSDQVATPALSGLIAGPSTQTLTVGPTGTLAQADELVQTLLGCATGLTASNIAAPSGYSGGAFEQNSSTYIGLGSAYKTVAATTAVSAAWQFDVSNGGGQTAVALLASYRIAASGPTITAQPTDQTVNNGATATFSVTATGTAPITYQWQDNSSGSFANIGGATSSSYAPTASYAMQGRQYRCLVSDAGGGPVTSSAAALRVAANLSGTGPRVYPGWGHAWSVGAFGTYTRGAVSGGAGAQTLNLGGRSDADGSGGLTAIAGAVSLALGGRAEQDAAGGFVLGGQATLQLGGWRDLDGAGGAAVSAGAATLAIGGALEPDRTGGAAVVAGAVTVALGGTGEPERAGGAAIQVGVQTLQLGGANEANRAGGLAVTAGTATVQPGGNAERDLPGGLTAQLGAATINLGGGSEAERAGGFAAAPGSIVLGLGGLLEREATGGAQVLVGVQVLAVGGSAELERAGGASASAGAVTLQLGGANERESSGGHQALPGVVGITIGGWLERERGGGLVTTIGGATLLLGGGDDREKLGGAALLAGPVQILLGGNREQERAGGMSAVDGIPPVIPTWPAGGTARIGGTPLADGGDRLGSGTLGSGGKRLGGSPLTSRNRRIG